MKTSNRILSILLLAVLAATAGTAFYSGAFVFAPLNKNARPAPLQNTTDEWSKDSLVGNYHYIWTDFPEVELNPYTENVVEMYAAGNAGQLFKVEIRNDTLFIRQNPPNDYQHYTHLETRLREYSTRIIAGGKGLKGITAINRGRIFHLGHERTDLNMVWPELEDQMFRVSEQPLEFDDLDINLHQGGDAVLKINANTINVRMSGRSYFHTYSRLRIHGQCRRLSLHHQGNQIDVKTHQMQVDTVFVDTQTPLSQQTSRIRLRADKYLNAKIRGWSNVIYHGQPTIKKREWSIGRLIDGNYYP